MIGNILRTLKVIFIDSFVNILGDLFQQPIIMWVFIGWGWIAVLAMLASMVSTIGSAI